MVNRLSRPRWVVGAMLLHLFSSTVGFAATQSPGKKADQAASTKGIPTKPEAPMQLYHSAGEDPFGCPRSFVQGGKSYSCDSYLQRDGEGLRNAVRDVPESVSEMDTYRKSRHLVRDFAYVGSAAAVFFLLGVFLGSRAKATGSPRMRLASDLLYCSGLWAGANLFMFGFGTIRSNDDRLHNAVDLYNQSNPDKPIELKLQYNF